MRALCDALADQYPDLTFFPVDPSRPLPPGSRVIPAAAAAGPVADVTRRDREAG
jgi:hypothetical protein